MCTLRSVVRPLLTALLAVGVVLRPGPAASLGTAFTYQGQLQQSGLPANGSCDMQFSLFGAASRGAQIGSTQTAPAVDVTNGLFTVPLDFGSVFTGIELYLEIQVRCPAGGGSYVLLSPRQHLTGAPYALYAPTAGNLSCSGCVTAGDLASGAVTGSAILDGAIAQGKLAFTPVLSVGATGPLTSSLGQSPSISLTGIVPVLNGGTGASTQANARANLSAAASGANDDITSLHGITGNIFLPASTNDAGNIWKGGMLFLHNYGTGNTFMGNSAGNLTLTGSYNTAVGGGTLSSNTSGYNNTAVGSGGALTTNTTGHDNTALGRAALRLNQTYDETQCTGSGAPNVCCKSQHSGDCEGNYNTAVGSWALTINTTGSDNTAVGSSSLETNTSGSDNTAVGTDALKENQTYDVTQCTGAGVPNACCTGSKSGSCTGNSNTAVGSGALTANTTGSLNTAVGRYALKGNTTGYDNSAVGPGALYSNTTGHTNTAVGGGSLYSNTTGPYNTAVGNSSLTSNTTGSYNTAVGLTALSHNNTGAHNTALGSQALFQNDGGNSNTAVGDSALLSNTSGIENTAVGQAALQGNTSGDNNTAVGTRALAATTGHDNTALGWDALAKDTSGIGNIAIGTSAGFNLTTEYGNIDIGNQGVTGESNTIRIGTPGVEMATYIAGIAGAISSGAEAVFVDREGKLGTLTSSARFKDDIQDMGDASSGVMKLRPVRFHYKPDLDPSGLEQYGLVAEEVARAYPDLVTYDDEGRPQSVRYHFVNAMLLNEVQKQARQIETQQEQIAVQARQIEAQAQQLEALTARLGQVETMLR